MNIVTKSHPASARYRALLKVSPPRVSSKSSLNVKNQDSVQLSEAASTPRLNKTALMTGASLFSVAVGLLGALGPANVAAVEQEVTVQTNQEQTNDSLVRQVLTESHTDLGTLHNPRFQNFDEFAKMGLDDAFAKGEEGPHIQAVQRALLDMGFAIDAGATGGLYNQTLQALNNFRHSVDLQAREDLDSTTLQLLDKLAPPPGKTLSEHPTASFPSAPVINGKPARVLVKIEEHRLFFYGPDGTPQNVYPVATGKRSKPTDPGVKVVNYKYDDPTHVARQLWPESGGKAFGTRMIDLKWYNPETGEVTSSDEEIHGTYVGQSIGTDASSGCVRMYNRDVEQLYGRLGKGDLVVFE